jgi:hypothetical protein
VELLNAVRILWRRRMVLLAGVVLTAAVTALLAHGGGTGAAPTGAAIARVLVDRPHSLIVNTDPDGADTAQIRAELLADLTAGSDAARTIARNAGVSPAELVVNGPHVAATVLGSPLSERAAAGATALARPYFVGVNVAVAAPLVTIDTKAPDVAGAVRLANAAVTTLTALASTTEADGPSAVVIRPLGRPQATAVPAPGASKKLALAAGVLLFGAWVFATLAVRRLPRLPRRRLAT